MRIDERNVVFCYPFREYLLNIGVILGAEHSFVIDTGLGEDSVREALSLVGRVGKPVIAINTHCHFDHIWGNHCFERIISHPLCRQAQLELWEQAFEQFCNEARGRVIKKVPSIVCEELYFAHDGVRLFSSAGHSLDGISVLDEVSGVLYAGDNVGDLGGEIVPHLTDKEAFLRTLKEYERIDFKLCVSGHNRVITKQQLMRMRDEVDRCFAAQGAVSGALN